MSSLTSSHLSSQDRFEPAVVAPEGDLGVCLFLAFQDDRMLVHLNREEGILSRLASFEELGIAHRDPHYLGKLDGVHCFAADLAVDAEPPVGMTLQGLRKLYGAFDDVEFQLAGRAFQIVNWDRTHHFCGRCGTATVRRETDRARQCPDCGLLSFPKVSPAIITLIHRGSEFLLARNARFPAGRYSIIAGFVEPGETLEEAVVRETREEVGMEVRDVKYFGSQPWPFPHSLMVGFTATWASGDIRIDEEEIVDAGWFTHDNLPDLPDRVSISRWIIDSFLAASCAGRIPYDGRPA
ncbi:MAG: NAD(+) diphosphatase [Candidatus Latescibacterota bacterium]|nr:NAD(+) diphosphatase [Candidatus Latescibacterota bacterium]